MANGKKAALAALKGTGIFVGYFILQNVALFAGQFIAGRQLAADNPGKVFSTEELQQFAMEYNTKNSCWFIIIATVLMLLIMFIASLIRKKRFTDTVGMNKTTPKKALGGALIGLGAAPLILAILSLLPQSLMANYADSTSVLTGGSMLLTFFGTVVCAPVIEEIICRGFIFKGMRKHVSFAPAAIVSSVIFGLAHSLSGFSVVWISYAFALGLILAIVCEKTDSIIPTICLHIAFNTYGTIISGLLAPFAGIPLLIIQAVAGAALITAGFFLLRKKEAVSNAIRFEVSEN